MSRASKISLLSTVSLKTYSYFLWLLVCLPAAASALSQKEFLSLEGSYNIEVHYTHLDGEKPSRLDKMIVLKNQGKDSYTVSLAVSDFNLSFIRFDDVHIADHQERLELRGEGELHNGVYGELHLFVDLQSFEVEGYVTDSVATGFKRITGGIDYSLSGCLYEPLTEGFLFPNLKELIGEYSNDEGHELLLRVYSSGAVSVVFRKKLESGVFANVKYKNGTYNQSLGLIVLPYEEARTQGKANVTYRLDEDGQPYLKLFSLGTGGVSKVRKFYFKRAILDLP